MLTPPSNVIAGGWAYETIFPPHPEERPRIGADVRHGGDGARLEGWQQTRRFNSITVTALVFTVAMFETPNPWPSFVTAARHRILHHRRRAGAASSG